MATVWSIALFDSGTPSFLYHGRMDDLRIYNVAVDGGDR